MAEARTLQPDHLRRLNAALLWVEQRRASIDRSLRNTGQKSGYILSQPGLAKLNGSLSQGGSASASVWAWNGSAFADTGVDVTVYDWLMKVGATAIASGKKILFTSAGGINVVTEAECP